jgi:hypothetical protein
VRQGIFELTDSRKLNGHSLHEGTLVFAAVNGGEHGSQYQVGEMDPAELDRWTVFDIEPTVEDWLDWAKDSELSSEVWDFINHNHAHLEHNDDYEPNKVYPSRRSWERLDECLQNAKALENKDGTLLFQLTSAFVGFEAAVAFKDFVANYDRQVTIADLLVKGDFSKVVDFGINEHTAMVAKFESSETFTTELPEAQINNLARYFFMLPSEVAMKLWSVLGSSDVVNNLVNLHQATVDDRSVSDFLVEILGDVEST